MSENICEEERVEFLVLKAAGVHQWMKDSNTLPMSMCYVGFTEEECRNRTLQQRVRRRLLKNVSDRPSSVVASLDGATSVSELSSPANLFHSSSSSTTISSSKWNTHCSTEGLSTPRKGSTPPGIDLDGKFAAVDQSSSAGRSMPPLDGTKTCRTPHQLQEQNAAFARMKANEKESLKIITTMVTESRKKFTDPKDKRRISVAEAVRKVNGWRGSNVPETTARKYVREGKIGESPSRPGPAGKFPTKDLQGASHGVPDVH